MNLDQYPERVLAVYMTGGPTYFLGGFENLHPRYFWGGREILIE